MEQLIPVTKQDPVEDFVPETKDFFPVGRVIVGCIIMFICGFGMTNYILGKGEVESDEGGASGQTADEGTPRTAQKEASAIARAQSGVQNTTQTDEDTDEQPAVVAQATDFKEHFSGDFSLEETDREEKSDSSEWWLNSGAYLYRDSDTGTTIQGKLTEASPWHETYRKENNRATDGGSTPQNLFRLIKRGAWLESSQEVYFRINKYNLSPDPDRRESNGLLLFSRYLDDDNLYYGGLRVDGNAIIKRKVGGTYHTLAEVPVLTGESYNRDTNPNLIPLDTWIGIKTEIRDQDDGTTKISLFIDNGRTYDWKLVAEAYDDGKSYGGPLVKTPSRAGIRTDFMDASFDDYRIREL